MARRAGSPGHGPGHFDAADDINVATLEFLAPLLPDACDDVLAITGALHIRGRVHGGAAGRGGSAWATVPRGRRPRLPADYYHPVTSFSRAIMGAHAVTVAVELHAGWGDRRQAAASDATTIPSRPRRARHRIEEARGYQLDGQPEAALATLDKALAAAPETIKLQRLRGGSCLEETGSEDARPGGAGPPDSL